MPPTNTLVVLGPTASGKTGLAVAIARALGGEVLSADSRQVYRGLDIGSGKDLHEYGNVPYHLIDIADLNEEFSVFHYQRAAHAAWEDVVFREKLPVFCGGTGLYLEAVLSRYRMVEAPEDAGLRAALQGMSEEELGARLRALQPQLHNTTDLTNRARTVRAIEIAMYSAAHPAQPAPPIQPVVLGTVWEREELRKRIRVRLRERIEQGLIEEVEALLNSGVSSERLELLGLEYRFVSKFLTGEIKSRNDLFQKLAAAIDQFAKRQDTWFRRMERKGTEIHWVPRADFTAAMDAIRQHG